MRYSICLFIISYSIASAQLSFETIYDSTVRKYHIGASTYFDAFKGVSGYGAIAIQTKDGGGAAFGDGDEGTMLIKLDKNGKVSWKKKINPKGEEIESQAVAQDGAGNFYVFQLVYDATKFKYRGGCERVVMINKAGAVGWDKYIGTCMQVNSPTVSYIKTAADGRVYMRGHIVLKASPGGKDPEYRFWEGWLNSAGVLTQKSGDAIDWAKDEWQKKFKPD